MKISNFNIGKNRTFIIAELSANHNHDFDIAVKSIKAMKEAGADAVKIQTYTADTMTLDCDNKYFRIDYGTIWDGTTLYKLYQEAYTPWEWQPKLKKITEDLGMIFFSTPFDKSAVDFLEGMQVPAYKIASFEITDIPLIQYVASKGKPIIISTGIADKNTIVEAIETCRKAGNQQIALLKCTSEYPTSLDEVNLLTIPDMIRTFETDIGISDHTLGFSIPVAAVALGACIIEKHFILDRNMGGPDASFSLNPAEFKTMTEKVREVEKALGSVRYDLSDKMMKMREKGSRSLFVAEKIKSGEEFTEKNIRSIRPGNGLHPRHLNEIIGKRASCDLEKGTPFEWKYIA